MASELTDEQVLGVLANMEQEQNFYDQMRLSWKRVGDVIKRFKEVQAKMPELEARHRTLTENLGTVEGEIESQRRAGALKIQKEFDTLKASMHEKIGPLAQALEEASGRVIKAESLAVEAEAASLARIQSATSAAEAAESRLAKAENALRKLESLTRR